MVERNASDIKLNMDLSRDKLPPSPQGETAETEDEGASYPLFAQQYPLRILIAEDDYINRRCIILLLQRLGYRADYVENGRECLTAVLQRPYDAILSDINMPEMDGVECSHSIREAGIHTPIIAVTADIVNNTREYCLDAGMNGYIMKPVTMNELKRALRYAFIKKQISPDDTQFLTPDSQDFSGSENSGGAASRFFTANSPY